MQGNQKKKVLNEYEFLDSFCCHHNQDNDCEPRVKIATLKGHIRHFILCNEMHLPHELDKIHLICWCISEIT